MSSTIGEPFLLYSSNVSARKASLNNQVVYTTYSSQFRRHATLTVQADGVHVVDIENLHSVVSHTVGDHASFSAPAFSRCVVEGDVRLSVTYVVIKQAPEVAKGDRERTIWIMKQVLSAPRIVKDEKKTVVTPDPPVRICGVHGARAPLLLVSKSGGLSLASPEVEITAALGWPGERDLLDVFVFPAASCAFVQHDAGLGGAASVACVCCRAGPMVCVRLVLVGEEIVHVGTCELPVDESGVNAGARIVGLTCSASGVLSYMTSRGSWNVHQLLSPGPSLLHTTPMTDPLQLHRFAVFKQKTGNPGIAMVALTSSLVLLAASIVGSPQDIYLQLWDLRYGVVLASQTFSPSSLVDTLPYINLVVVDEGQVLLTLSPSLQSGKSQGSSRSTVYVVPFDQNLKSSLATALGKSSATEEWLVPQTPESQPSTLDANKAALVAAIEVAITSKKPHQADEVFFSWVQKQNPVQPALGHEFVKRIVNAVLSSEWKGGEQYSPRIVRVLLENDVVNATMLDGKLISRLLQRGDWENIMLAMQSVVDVSEDEMMSSVKFINDTHHKRGRNPEATMDSSDVWIPSLETFLSACISHDFSSAAMRSAIRRHVSDGRDLVMILEIMESWLDGGTVDDMEAVFKSVATGATATIKTRYEISPPYPKIITFLQALLDASCIALVQYRPSRESLRRVLAQIEPEIVYIERMEQLCGALEPFVRAHARKSKERSEEAPKESPAECRKRRKRLEQQVSMGVGLYRLEELVL